MIGLFEAIGELMLATIGVGLVAVLIVSLFATPRD